MTRKDDLNDARKIIGYKTGKLKEKDGRKYDER